MMTNAEPARALIASQRRGTAASMATILWFDDPRCIDVGQVGGKNASLANMTCSLARAGIRVPPGFAVTAGAYRSYLQANGIDARMRDQLDSYHAGRQTLARFGTRS
jgi:pyruvate,water dikinase